MDGFGVSVVLVTWVVGQRVEQDVLVLSVCVWYSVMKSDSDVGRWGWMICFCG